MALPGTVIIAGAEGKATAAASGPATSGGSGGASSGAGPAPARVVTHDGGHWASGPLHGAGLRPTGSARTIASGFVNSAGAAPSVGGFFGARAGLIGGGPAAAPLHLGALAATTAPGPGAVPAARTHTFFAPFTSQTKEASNANEAVKTRAVTAPTPAPAPGTGPTEEAHAATVRGIERRG